MSLMSAAESRLAEAIARLAVCNPFTPERQEAEHAVLGDEAVGGGSVWSFRRTVQDDNPNIPPLGRRAGELADTLRARIEAGTPGTAAQRELYEDVALYVLFDRYRDAMRDVVAASAAGRPVRSLSRLYADFARDVTGFLGHGPHGIPPHDEPAHLFAFFFQVTRAFHHVFAYLVGGSRAGARLRAQVWQSIFTHDLRRYQRSLYRSMGDINTLITGPSGTGKELVARAIGLARYIPFDPSSCTFAADLGGEFLAVNLSALSPTLIESELFGHRRGAFTGALADRAGWFERCGPHGTVLLDEIGDVDKSIQVKLLRVLQSRTFTRLGGAGERRFEGKAMAATNRDLAAELAAGRFREDLYYRLCADVIVTPSLREQLAEAPGECRHIVRFIASRLVEDGLDAFVDDVERWIRERLGEDYPWPGNVRELEQCVRNVLIRREYHPLPRPPTPDAASDLAADLRAGALTAEQLLSRYCTLVYARTGTYEGTARRLGLDRRTVRKKVDPALLASLRDADAPVGDGRRPLTPGM